MSKLDFRASDQAGYSEFEPLPAGDYIVKIVASEMKETKNGQGEYLALEIEVDDGEFLNRKLFDNLTLVHSNEVAVKIARAKLTSITYAVGKDFIGDSSELHMIPFKIKVAVEERKDKPGVYSNVIKSYKSIDGQHAKPSSPATKPAETRAWRKN